MAEKILFIALLGLNKGTVMNQVQLDEVAQALKAKGALKPCPRCDSSNFSIIGESEIAVEKSPPKIHNRPNRHRIPPENSGNETRSRFSWRFFWVHTTGCLKYRMGNDIFACLFRDTNLVCFLLRLSARILENNQPSRHVGSWVSFWQE